MARRTWVGRTYASTVKCMTEPTQTTDVASTGPVRLVDLVRSGLIRLGDQVRDDDARAGAMAGVGNRPAGG